MANQNFTNKVALKYFYDRIKTIFADKSDIKIDDIKVNGTSQTPTNKSIDITVPTKTSDLTNDSNFQNATEVQTAIDAAVADITSFEFEVVTVLPATGQKGVIYLVENSGTAPNIYDEYIWVPTTTQGDQGHFEKIGTTAVDLTGYWNDTNLIPITTAEIDEIIDGPTP